MLFDAGIKIDSTDLTDEGRGPISRERETREVMVELASGKRKRYTKKVSVSYTMEWTNIPGSDNTIDSHAGRNWMAENLKPSNDVHTLTFRHESDDDEEVDVFVTAYSDSLTRRASDEFLWNVSITFEEQ
jgi:hypothetical protein